MINIDENLKFGVSWEVLEGGNGFYFGTVNFIIDDITVPSNALFNTTVNVIFGGMQNSFANKLFNAGCSGELGEKEVDYLKLDYGKEPNIFTINTTEFEMIYGGNFNNVGRFISLDLGYSGDEERLFYRLDPDSLSYIEVRLPRNTVEKVINSLPSTIEEFESQLNSTGVKLIEA